MEMIEYQRHAERTAGDHECLEDRLANFSMGLSGEAGEVTDYLKKVIFHGHELDKDKLCKELGDVLWYVATLATSAGLTLEDVAWKNVEKLRKRYPDGFDPQKSINREESKNTCPYCGTTLIYTGGCKQCPDPACGWSSCG